MSDNFHLPLSAQAYQQFQMLQNDTQQLSLNSDLDRCIHVWNSAAYSSTKTTSTWRMGPKLTSYSRPYGQPLLCSGLKYFSGCCSMIASTPKTCYPENHFTCQVIIAAFVRAALKKLLWLPILSKLLGHNSDEQEKSHLGVWWMLPFSGDSTQKYFNGYSHHGLLEYMEAKKRQDLQ